MNPSDKSITYREWAPNAVTASLVGEFSEWITRSKFLQSTDNVLPDNWDWTAHPMKKDAFGVFEIVLPAKDGQPVIPHNSKIKVRSNQELFNLSNTSNP